MKNKTKSVLAARRNRYGYVFIVPWIIGFLLFFLLPLGQSIYYSFCKVSPSDAGFSFDFIRLENYRYLSNRIRRINRTFGNRSSRFFTPCP